MGCTSMFAKAIAKFGLMGVGGGIAAIPSG